MDRIPRYIMEYLLLRLFHYVRNAMQSGDTDDRRVGFDAYESHYTRGRRGSVVVRASRCLGRIWLTDRCPADVSDVGRSACVAGFLMLFLTQNPRNASGTIIDWLGGGHMKFSDDNERMMNEVPLLARSSWQNVGSGVWGKSRLIFYSVCTVSHDECALAVSGKSKMFEV